MKLGLIGVNPLTQIAVDIQNSTNPDAKMFIYDDDSDKHQKAFFGLEVLNSISTVKDDYHEGRLEALHICLGEKYLNTKRKLFNEFEALGIEFPNFIHSSCLISPNSDIGKGNLISYGSIIGHNTIVKCNSSIWSGVVIEHDSIIHGHGYIGPNVTISGFVEVGECSLIGSGAVILPEVKIGKNCLIGAGAVVTKDVADNQIVKGNPAK